MAQFKTTELHLDHQIDGRTWRHYLNGELSVLHCHHYATLYSQLADDCELLDGKKLLMECAEDSFYPVLSNYFAENGIDTTAERIAIAEQYFAAYGLGSMRVSCAGPDSGEVVLDHSHVDEGWVKKWSKRDAPVNFIGCGYIAALFAAVFDRPTRAFDVTEVQSIVSGAECSRFNVVAN